MKITGSLADWENWTGLGIPHDGTYVFPDSLAPLEAQNGVGRYWEPNVWMLHNA